MSKFVSADIIRKINDIPIMDYINRVGIEIKQVTPGNPDYFKIPHNGGTYITPSKNVWNCFAMKAGSKSVLQFVQFIEKITWKEAVDKMVDIYNLQENKKDNAVSHNIEKEKIAETLPKKAEVVDEKKEFILPEKSKDSKRLFAYLHKTRGIDNDIIQRAYNEKKIYQDAQKGNVIFKIIDDDGNVKGAAWNTTLTNEEHRGKKGFVKDSIRDYPFELRGTNNELYIFESPIDMMSYMTIQQNGNCINIKDSTFIATWGINSEEMIIKYLKKNPHIDDITIGYDNDKDGFIIDKDGKYRWNHGQEAAKLLKEKLEKLNEKYIIEIDKPNQKDFNDDLLIMVKDGKINYGIKNLKEFVDEKEQEKKKIVRIEQKIDNMKYKIKEKQLDILYEESLESKERERAELDKMKNKLAILEQRLSEIKEKNIDNSQINEKNNDEEKNLNEVVDEKEHGKIQEIEKLENENKLSRQMPKALEDLYAEEKIIQANAKSVVNSIEEMQNKLTEMKKNYETTITQMINVKNKMILQQEQYYEEIIKNNAYVMIQAGVSIDIVSQATKIPDKQLEAMQKEVIQQTQHSMFGQTPKIDYEYEFEKNLEQDEEYYQVLEKS